MAILQIVEISGIIQESKSTSESKHSNRGQKNRKSKIESTYGDTVITGQFLSEKLNHKLTKKSTRRSFLHDNLSNIAEEIEPNEITEIDATNLLQRKRMELILRNNSHSNRCSSKWQKRLPRYQNALPIILEERTELNKIQVCRPQKSIFLNHSRFCTIGTMIRSR
ncbi:uncharacterized protein LOC144430838 [Styela clava]